MVIDTHIRPALFSPICENKERFEKRCDQMNYHLMKPSSIELLKKQYALAGIEKYFCFRQIVRLKRENRIYQTTRSRRSYNVIRRFLSGLRLQIRERNRRQKNWKRRLSSKIWRDFISIRQDYICIPVMKDYLCCMIYVRNIKGRSFFRQD